MVMVSNSKSLFIVKANKIGYRVKAYMQDQSNSGTGSKIWLDTFTDFDGKRLAKQSQMETTNNYNELNSLLQKVITKHKEQNK